MSGSPGKDKTDNIIQTHSRSDEGDSDREDDREKDGISISKAISVVIAAILIVASGGFFLIWDYSGDGLANHRQMPIIGDVEGDWREYDSSDDGLSDGEAQELGLNPAEPYPGVSAAYNAGLSGEKALAFQNLHEEVGEEKIEAVVEYIAGLDDPAYRREVVDYLTTELEYIPALFTEDHEVSELAFEFKRDFEPDVLESIKELPYDETSREFTESILDLDVEEQEEYIEAVVDNGQLSELGVEATPDFDPDVVSEISQYPLSETGLDLLDSIYEMDAEEQVEYINAVDLEGELSALGVYAVDYLEPEVVEEVSPYPRNNVGKELIENIKEKDILTQQEYIDAVDIDGELSALGVYSISELPVETISELSPFDLDEVGEDMVEALAEADEANHTKYIDAAEVDSRFTELGVYSVAHLPPESVAEVSPYELDKNSQDLVHSISDLDIPLQLDYIEAVEHEDEISDLGVYSIEHLEPEVIEEVSPYERTEAAEDLIENILDMDKELQKEYIDAVGINGLVSELAVDYVEEDNNPEALSYLAMLEDTKIGRSFADNVTQLDWDMQYNVSSAYAYDGYITPEQLNQARFLNEFDLPEEYDPTEKDLSNDGFTNWFSINKSDWLDPLEKNRVFAAHINALEGDSDARSRHFRPLVEDAEIPEERIWKRFNESATWEEFQNVTDQIAENMTENDKLVLSTRTHGGSDGTFIFWNLGVPPEWVAGEIEPIPGLTMYNADLCYGGAGKEHFEDLNNTITLFSADENNTASAARFPGVLWHLMRHSKEEVRLFDSRFQHRGAWRFIRSPDLNGDGEVSLEEAWKSYQGYHLPPYNMTPEDYQDALYENVSDPQPRRWPQVVGDLDWMDSFYIAQGLAEDKAEDEDHFPSVSHPK